MDGLALVQNIRERYPRLPVILMTAYGSEDVAIQALRAGAANYVPKKALGRELAATLRHVLESPAVDRSRQKLLGALERRESPSGWRTTRPDHPPDPTCSRKTWAGWTSATPPPGCGSASPSRRP